MEKHHVGVEQQRVVPKLRDAQHVQVPLQPEKPDGVAHVAFHATQPRGVTQHRGVDARGRRARAELAAGFGGICEDERVAVPELREVSDQIDNEGQAA